MQKDTKTIVSWEEVVNEQHNGRKAYHIPHTKERQGQFFERKIILLTDIPYEKITPLIYFKDSRYFEDIQIIVALIHAYKNREPVPPVIFSKTYDIIDGFHRMAALYELQTEKIEIFKEL